MGSGLSPNPDAADSSGLTRVRTTSFVGGLVDRPASRYTNDDVLERVTGPDISFITCQTEASAVRLVELARSFSHRKLSYQAIDVGAIALVVVINADWTSSRVSH